MDQSDKEVDYKKQRTGQELPPDSQEVGNHHWPFVSNIFAEHGARFPKHHSHTDMNEKGLRALHNQVGFDKTHHDRYAEYHTPKEEPGCRSPEK